MLPYLRLWCLLSLLVALPICQANTPDVFQVRRPTYDLPSAIACRVVLANVHLDCTIALTGATPAECYATSLPFLSTLAKCIEQHAPDLKPEIQEAWWARYAVGWNTKQPVPAINMSFALNVVVQPNNTLTRGQQLTDPAIVSDGDFKEAKRLVVAWNESEKFHEISG
jgi:hypothetical protein